MVNQSLDTTFSALADPTRRALLTRLSGGERTVSELAEPFEMSLPAVSKHLRVLEEAGLVTKRYEGRTVYCTLKANPMREAAAWIETYRRFWTDQLDRLETFLKQEKN